MRIIGIIPARLNSTRLPNKPLLDINGKPMIQHVYERVIKSNLDDVIVACDDQLVYNTVTSFGGKAIMTSPNHLNGSTRIAEVAKNIMADYIINIQGDEPMISFEVINDLLKEIDSSINVITLKQKIDNDIDVDNPNIVKIITDVNNNAIYFSRSRIPYNRNPYRIYYKHIGIYGFKKEFLIKYVDMLPTKLEVSESLEQLRIIENGYKIKVVETNHKLLGVDTIDDLVTVRKLLIEED